MLSLLRIVLGLLVVAISLATAQIKMNVVTPVRRVRASLGTGKACADRLDTDRLQDPALVIFGRPLPILWDGGRRPFELSIVKADNLSHTVRLSAVVCNRLGAVLLTHTCVLPRKLSSLHGLHWSWSTTWMVDLPPGTSISVRVEVRAR
jgi:hypothetical protein